MISGGRSRAPITPQPARLTGPLNRSVSCESRSLVGAGSRLYRWFLVAPGRCLLELHSMRGRATMRDLSVFAGGFACPTDEFPLPWPSTPAEQPGGLDTKATEQERTHGHRCRTHHRRAAAARVLPHGLGAHRRTGSPGSWLSRFRDLGRSARPGAASTSWSARSRKRPARPSAAAALIRNSARRCSRWRRSTSPTCGPCSENAQHELQHGPCHDR
jgi:hypothetical protein